MHLTIGTMNITFLYQAGLPSDHLCAKLDTLSNHYVQMKWEFGYMEGNYSTENGLEQKGFEKSSINVHHTLPDTPSENIQSKLLEIALKRASLITVNNVPNYTLTSHFRKKTAGFYFATEA